jgi:hypothetical protein
LRRRQLDVQWASLDTLSRVIVELGLQLEPVPIPRLIGEPLGVGVYIEELIAEVADLIALCGIPTIAHRIGDHFSQLVTCRGRCGVGIYVVVRRFAITKTTRRWGVRYISIEHHIIDIIGRWWNGAVIRTIPPPAQHIAANLPPDMNLRHLTCKP